MTAPLPSGGDDTAALQSFFDAGGQPRDLPLGTFRYSGRLLLNKLTVAVSSASALKDDVPRITDVHPFRQDGITPAAQQVRLAVTDDDGFVVSRDEHGPRPLDGSEGYAMRERQKDTLKPWMHFVMGLAIVVLGIALHSRGESAAVIALGLTLWWFYG